MEYDPSTVQSSYLDIFPEWKYMFVGNIEVLKLTGFLLAPVGGFRRFSGLSPTPGFSLAKLALDQDFIASLTRDIEAEEILTISRRTAAGTALHVADVIKSILTGDGREHVVQVMNKGMLSAYPQNAVLQVSCRINGNGIQRPILSHIPDFIEGTLASRIMQEWMKGNALAKQDEKTMLQAMFMVPEGVDPKKVLNTVRSVT